MMEIVHCKENTIALLASEVVKLFHSQTLASGTLMYKTIFFKTI